MFKIKVYKGDTPVFEDGRVSSYVEDIVDFTCDSYTLDDHGNLRMYIRDKNDILFMAFFVEKTHFWRLDVDKE